ncbi:MAG: DUF58 domain-containing protein [Pirellulales bacterium]
MITPASSPFRHVDPVTLMRIKSLELRARHVVEGFFTGLHRSPYHGFSVEFTEYRQYVPGDDPRYLDWRLAARSDRDYIKRFEDETNLCCQFILDASRSMAYGSLSHTKIDYARTLVATLAWFLSQQRDAVGLATFADRLVEYVPPRHRAGHFRRLLVQLERAGDAGATALGPPLEEVADRFTRRGMVVVVSDLLATLDDWETALGAVVGRGHEVLVLQVLDPAEIEFPFADPAWFENVESGQRMYVDPAAARASYLRKFAAHDGRVRALCERLGVVHRRLRTDEPLEHALFELLQLRQHAGRRVVRRRAAGNPAAAGGARP